MYMFSFFAFYLILTREVNPTRGEIQGSEVTEEYANGLLDKLLTITEMTRTSSGDSTDHPLDNAFDDDANTYWESSTSITGSNNPIIQINFTEVQDLDGMIYYSVFTKTGDINNYLGFPETINIYADVTNSSYQLKYVVKTSTPSEVILINFSRILWCDKLRLEFVSPTNCQPACRKLYFIKVQNPNYQHINLEPSTFSTNYMAQHKIQYSECFVNSSGDKIFPSAPRNYGNRGIIDIFDSADSSHWGPDQPNTADFKSYVYYKFNQIECIDGILYEGAYSSRTGWREFYAFPFVINIYARDLETDQFELKYVSTGMPEINPPGSKISFIRFPNKSLWTDELKIEFEEIQLNTVFGLADYTPAAKFIFVMRETIKSPRLDYEATETGEHKNVSISGTSFNDIHEAVEFGGAVYLRNCALDCSSTTFINCQSSKAGGGIYLKIQGNFIDKSDPATFNGLTFTGCQSGYGGAICVIAKRGTDITSIVGCRFDSNVANPEHGGSALFLYTNKAKVQGCTFTGSSGSSTIIRYATSDPSDSTTATILSTDFEFEVRDCIFEDQHQDSTFYINIDESIQQSPHILLTNNQLSNSAQLSKTTFKDQHHNEATTQTSNNNNRTNNRNIFLMILIPSLVVISLLFLLIIYRHHNDNQENSQETTNNA